MPRNPYEQRTFDLLMDGISAVQGPLIKNTPSPPPIIPISPSKVEAYGYQQSHPPQSSVQPPTLPLESQLTIAQGLVTHQVASFTDAWRASLPSNNHDYEAAYRHNLQSAITTLMPNTPLPDLLQARQILEDKAFPKCHSGEFMGAKTTIFQQIASAVISLAKQRPPFTDTPEFVSTISDLPPFSDPQTLCEVWENGGFDSRVKQCSQTLLLYQEEQIIPPINLIKKSGSGPFSEIRTSIKGPGFVGSVRPDQTLITRSPDGPCVKVSDYKTGDPHPANAGPEGEAARISAWLVAQAALGIAHEGLPNRRINVSTQYHSGPLPPNLTLTYQNIGLGDDHPEIVDVLAALQLDLHDPKTTSHLHQQTMELVNILQEDVDSLTPQYAQIFGLKPRNLLQKLARWILG